MINPIPDEAALQLGILVDGVPIVLEAAHTVAHSVAVFGDDVGAGVLWVACIVGEVLHRGVHDADDVGIGSQLGTLVDHGARGVLALQDAVGFLKADAVAALVAEAPGDNAGVVAVATVHVVDAVEDGVEPFLLFGQRTFAVALCMALHVGLVPDIDAGRVAQVVPEFVVGVVASAYGIDAHLLHETYVLAHLCGGNVVATIHRVFVAVDPTYLHRFAVKT